jgi:hypothetical protein
MLYSLERHECANNARIKMADHLAQAWQKHECKLVKQTIDGAGDALMREQWKRDTARNLLPTERDFFNAYIGD